MRIRYLVITVMLAPLHGCELAGLLGDDPVEVTGTVVDASTREPLARVPVEILGARGLGTFRFTRIDSASTSPSGAFAFTVDRAGFGDLELEVNAPGGRDSVWARYYGATVRIEHAATVDGWSGEVGLQRRP